MAQQKFSITVKQLGHDKLYTAQVMFCDESGYVLASEKKSFRNDPEAAEKWAKEPRELKSAETHGSARNTSARDQEPRTEYSITRKAKA